MEKKKSTKKIIRVGNEESSNFSTEESAKSVASVENKSKAGTFRLIAVISWLIAIACEVVAIFQLKKVPVNTTVLIILIVVALVFAVTGSLLWKRANRFNPASQKDKIRFFIQNQLGLIISIIAFLPLVILIFTNKNMSGKQKGLVGAIAVAALVIAGITGIDFNPPSQEEYKEQTEEVKSLNDGINHVYWTKYGKSYHLYKDCSYINTDRTDEIYEGTVAQAKELKNITDLCDRCAARAKKEKGLEQNTMNQLKEESQNEP